jgi:hypothetical protein
MFYEGLYLYQKTGVHTARTLYNPKRNYDNKYDACAQDQTGAPNNVIVKI